MIRAQQYEIIQLYIRGKAKDRWYNSWLNEMKYFEPLDWQSFLVLIIYLSMKRNSDPFYESQMFSRFLHCTLDFSCWVIEWIPESVYYEISLS